MNRNSPECCLTSKLVSAALVYVVLLGVAAVYAWPLWPRTGLGWFVFLVFAPVFVLIAEWLGEVLDREPLGRWVDSRTAEHRFSGMRVLYQLIKSLAFLGTVGGIAWAVYHRIPGLAHFLQENFGPMSSP